MNFTDNRSCACSPLRKDPLIRFFSQLVARVEAQLRQRDGWIMAEMEAARSNDLLDQVAEAPIDDGEAAARANEHTGS